MSAFPVLPLRMDFTDYLSWEGRQATRHEFVAGLVYEKGKAPSPGARSSFAVHDRIIFNLGRHLTVSGCQVDLSQCMPLDEASLCPDLCGYREAAPVLIAEVLSDSTAAYDRGLKFEQYQRLPSLQEYLLIEQDRVHVDLFRRNAEGLWVLHPAGPGDTVTLASVDLSLPIEAFYEDTDTGATRTT